MAGQSRVEVVIKGMGTGLVAFVAVELMALFLSLAVRFVERYTRWFDLGAEWDTWLGVVFVYRAVLPAILVGLIVGGRKIKSGWNS